MQVTVDLRVGARTVKRRWTADAANAFVDDAMRVAGLTPIAPRALVNLPDRLIFFQLMAESHVSGHLMREYRLGWVDVFSCLPLDPAEVRKAIRRHLAGPRDSLKVRVLGRAMLPEGGTDGAHDSGARAQVRPG